MVIAVRRPWTWMFIFCMWGQPAFAALLPTLTDSIRTDYATAYSQHYALNTCAFIGIAGVIANTNVDKEIRENWQSHVRNGTTNAIASPANAIGGMPQVLGAMPFYVGVQWIADLHPDYYSAQWLGRWSNHAFRVTAVVAPQQWVLTQALGSDRPRHGNAHWHPLHPRQRGRSVSGHASYGAIPFLSAAAVVEDPLLSRALYLLSTVPAFARVNDDHHYFSQAFLGWGLSYMASKAVSRSPDKLHWKVVPLKDGLALVYTYTYK